MDFRLSKEHQMVRKLFRDFAEKEVKPLAQEIDEMERFPYETVEKLSKYGMMGLSAEKQYGGQGADSLTAALCSEELARVCATTSVIMGAQDSLVIKPIQTYGTPAQKEKYLPQLASGKKLGGFCLTEAGAGTDSASQQTKAVLDGDEYVLNGSKIFITNGGVAEIFVVLAMTDKSQGNRGISAFIVEKSTPGFSVGLPEKKLGIRGSSTTEIIFENCRIPKENLLGKEGKGFAIAMNTLDGGRIGIGAQAIGIAQGALDLTVQYVKERKQFGRPISAFQNTQFELAAMKTRIEAGRLLVYSAACKKDLGENFTTEAAMAKLFCSETAMDVTTRCVQLHGGYGFMREYSIERMMRDAKITQIYEGTSEVQKMVISGSLLR